MLNAASNQAGSALFAKINALLVMLDNKNRIHVYMYDQALIHYGLIGDKS